MLLVDGERGHGAQSSGISALLPLGGVEWEECLHCVDGLVQYYRIYGTSRRFFAFIGNLSTVTDCALSAATLVSVEVIKPSRPP
ncbi:hypothetical protein PM082_009818 [Marasmius tenuissimus]|nr:hypothetical protein PM082_009818 [Marasmius tenuissimus]